MAFLTSRSALRKGVAIAALSATLTTPALAEFPGEEWGVGFVRVTGDIPPATVSTVNRALAQANQTYFYGDRATRMEATVQGSTVDVRIVDMSSGDVMAERRGLPFGGDANALTASALAWMDSLECGQGCAVAVLRGVDTPPVQVAAAPLPVPEAPNVDATEPPAPDVAAVEITAPSAPAVEIPAASVTEVPVVAVAPPAAVEPNVPSLAAGSVPLIAGTQPQTGGSDAPVEGLDADLVLAEAARAEAQVLANPGLTGGSTPSVSGSASAPAVPAPTLSEPSLVPTAPERPSGVTPRGQTQVTSAPDTVPQTVAPQVTLAEPGRTQIPAPSGELTTGSAAPAATASGAPTTETVIAAADPARTGEPAQPSGTIGGQAPSVGAAGTQPTGSIAITEPTGGASPAPTTGTASAAPAPGASSQSASPSAAPAPATPVEAPAPQIAILPAQPEGAPSAPVAAGTGDSQVALVNPAAPSPTEPRIVPPEAPTPEVSTTQISPTAATAGDAPAPVAPPETPEVAAPVVTTPEVIAPQVTTPEVTAAAPQPQPEPQPEPQPATEPVPQPEPTTPEVSPQIVATTPPVEAPSAAPAPAPVEAEPEGDIEIAAIDPTATGPTLANARWVGFTPAVFTGGDSRPGAWISGPFDRSQRTGWITDTATGATARVTFIWREAGDGGRTATLSQAAAAALGLGQGDVANVAVYLPR